MAKYRPFPQGKEESVPEWLHPSRADLPVSRGELIWWLQEFERARRSLTLRGRIRRRLAIGWDWIRRPFVWLWSKVYFNPTQVGKGEV
jgi:hypothetical protein